VGAAVLVSGSGLVVGLDLEHTDERRAENDLQGLVRGLPAGAVRAAATHWARLGDRPHVALSVELVDVSAALLVERLSQLGPRWASAADGEVRGDTSLRAAAQEARDAHVERRSGRAVHYPGVESLVGTLTVQELLEGSAVDRVQVLTAGDAPPHALVVTHGHVRPTWADGKLVLLTQPAVGGTLFPFESPSPTACCADH
jgi:hypothetical protein